MNSQPTPPRLPETASNEWSDSDASVAAEVLSPAETAAYWQRRTQARSPTSPPQPLSWAADVRRLGFPTFDPLDLSDEDRAMITEMARKGREALRAYRAHRRAAKHHGAKVARKPGVDIDAAIERAYARDLELARKTPERLWTDGMKRAVQRQRDEQKARRTQARPEP